MKNKHVIVFIMVLLVISICIGYIYGINNSYDLSNYIASLDSNNNVILKNIIVIIIFFFTTISLLGIFLQSIYLSFEGISIGYLLSQFYLNYKIKGILFGLINIFINKLLYLIIIIYLFYISYLFIKKVYKNMIGDNKDYYINIIKPIFYKYCIVFIIILINSIFIYFLGNNILKYFTFIIIK